MSHIETVILSAVVEGRIRPGGRLSETQLAQAFGVSRTLIREALKKLEARQIVRVSPRRGWFVNALSRDEAAHVFATRRAIEAGFLSRMPALNDSQLATLSDHLAQERTAIGAGDRNGLTYLMGDFHTRIIDLNGNPVLAAIMGDLTARTMLISMQVQSGDHAQQSHDGHCRIFAALQRHDHVAAAACAIQHLDEVEAGLTHDWQIPPAPLDTLRQTLRLSAPVAAPLSDTDHPFTRIPC